MTETEFQVSCRQRGLELNGEQLAKFREYTSFLVAENEKMNLTAITEEEEIYLKHYYDSLIFTYDIDFQGNVLDVGTGAGFPGVVLKIAYPQIRLTLLDSLGKRCRFPTVKSRRCKTAARSAVPPHRSCKRLQAMSNAPQHCRQHMICVQTV